MGCLLFAINISDILSFWKYIVFFPQIFLRLTVTKGMVYLNLSHANDKGQSTCLDMYRKLRCDCSCIVVFSKLNVIYIGKNKFYIGKNMDQNKVVAHLHYPCYKYFVHIYVYSNHLVSFLLRICGYNHCLSDGKCVW